MAVISVGGFSRDGQQTCLSAPWSVTIENDKIVMPGATKDALKGMPECKYNNT